MTRRLFVSASIACGALVAAACGGHSSDGGTAPDGAVVNPQHGDADGSLLSPGDDAGEPGSDLDGQAPGTDGTAPPSDAGANGASSDAALHFDGGYPAGWLYTSGATIYESNGTGSGTQWMGRGVNVDDIFMCGYDDSLWMASPATAIEQEFATLMAQWKPSFVRISLAMDSYGTVVSWLSDPSQYKTPMTGVINALGSYAGVHVLVTLRSDASMLENTAANDPESTGLPSSSTDTPNATKFPTGTDAVYVALVDSFANDGYVLFGLSNEPQGSAATVSAAMSHAVGVIRAEEDRLGVPHHIVSAQGIGYTSNVSQYTTAPLPYDNVVYEVHGYPPAPSAYWPPGPDGGAPNIPTILGEYGSLPTNDAGADPAFFADLEAKKIPSLAWDFDSYNDCAPDLVNVDQSSTSITPTTPWGTMVQAYLLAHAP